MQTSQKSTSNDNRNELIVKWNKMFLKAPPTSLSQSLMAYILDFERQAKSNGAIDRQTKAVIKKLQTQLSSAHKKPVSKNRQSKARAGSKFKSGTQFMREWNGVTHIVDVSEVGFEWQGQTFKSLSPIAKAITGAHWSGPRFFRLNKKGFTK